MTSANAQSEHSDANSSQREERARLSLMCEVRQGMRGWQWAHLDDLSPKGFKIAGLVNASMDKPISIRIPGMQLLSARICWRDGLVLGCEFSAPLHIAVFEHVVRAATPGGFSRG